MHCSRLVVRLVVGGLFIGHGTQKLKGWFGGSGPEGTDQMMASLGLHPPRRNTRAAGISETAGGALLATGLATPLASAALIGTMITAVRQVHAPNGPWVAQGGYEYNLVLIATLMGLAAEGPGELSLDHVVGCRPRGIAAGLGALALGAVASTTTIELARRAAPAEDVGAPTEPNDGGTPPA